MGNFSRKVKTLKIYQIKIWLEKAISEMKNSLDELNSRLLKISKLEDRPREIL